MVATTARTIRKIKNANNQYDDDHTIYNFVYQM